MRWGMCVKHSDVIMIMVTGTAKMVMTKFLASGGSQDIVEAQAGDVSFTGDLGWGLLEGVALQWVEEGKEFPRPSIWVSEASVTVTARLTSFALCSHRPCLLKDWP